jgi:UDP-glucose:(heptosyl)LPS alpha-1,3-glucosyltransferase
VTLFCSAVARAETAAPLRFETVEPVVRGGERLRYALECSSFARRATRAVSRRRSDFDLVHVEGFAAWDADLVTVHAVRPAEIEHYFTQVETRAVVRRRLSPLLFRPQSAAVMRIERRLFGRIPPPHCVCPSRAVAADLGRVYGVPSERIEVIPYGLEFARFAVEEGERERVRRELGTPEGRLVALFVGDAFERKGVDRALAGVARARVEAELWVVGGRESARTALTRRAGEAAGRLRILGRRQPHEIPPLLAAADVFLLPTQQDSWAIPVVEAMAAGLPVVTSRHAGSHEVIEDGSTGFVLAGSGSAEAIAALLDGPLADPLVRASIGARARTAAEAFDFERVYVRYRAAYHHAYELGRERGSPRPASDSRAIHAAST